MDMSKTIEADSTQINALDLVVPVTVTITGSSKGPDAKRPINLEVAEFPDRCYRPGLAMRRLIVDAWGPDTKTYVGRRMTLYNDKTVKFGPNNTGGVRVKALSDIDPSKIKNGVFTSTQMESQRKYVTYTVELLPDAPTPATLPAISDDDAVDFARAISEAGSVDELNKVGGELKSRDLGAHRSSLQAAWTARNNELKGTGA